jgi:hypothetical protein
VQALALWGNRLSSPIGVFSLVLTQSLVFVGYLAFWVAGGPTDSNLLINLELASFFLMPLVWLMLLPPGLWLLPRPLAPKSKVAVSVGVLLAGLAGGVAVGIATIFVFAEVVFRLTDF